MVDRGRLSRRSRRRVTSSPTSLPRRRATWRLGSTPRMRARASASSSGTSRRTGRSASPGTAWQQAEVPADPGDMYAVNLEGSQLVAHGREPSGTQERPMTWTSIDGGVWTLLPAGAEMPDLAGFSALSRAVVGGRACAAGTFY